MKKVLMWLGSGLLVTMFILMAGAASYLWQAPWEVVDETSWKKEVKGPDGITTFVLQRNAKSEIWMMTHPCPNLPYLKDDMTYIQVGRDFVRSLTCDDRNVEIKLDWLEEWRWRFFFFGAPTDLNLSKEELRRMT